ncbi:hypothetical protein D9613_008834 [Agrocybe pediades]|uniref:T6SS Phospholipase effector Tle1-like catalytic domain-containing protein n=1 Tax=Agrocybe pediades TaxID=84607 RepID=A0A8H4QSU5_9AGAR|nr:hypothetical protein D9613_008834 [Agrocybe pediades]
MEEIPRNAAGPSEGPPKKANTTQTNDPCCHGPIDTEKRRNLVISIDGTSNKFGAMNTNVIEHHSLLIKDECQIPYYNSGIGTYARPSWTSPKFIGRVLYHKIDLAIAWDFDKTVKDAYRWISENYETDDLIFMFGFSRGAFQVRVLSAMIEKVGLLHRGNELQIPFAYELYCDPATDERSETQRVTVAEQFKLTFSRENVKVHFVGVWDTVSSIGLVREAKMLPGTVNGMKHVCFFRHALALDERRVKFLPEYANGGKGPDEEATSGPIPHTKEVWFAGTHSDIGGGNTLNLSLNLTRPTLRWMVYEAGPLGLRTTFKRDLKNDEKVLVKESLTWVWWPFEYLPFRRLTYTRKENKKEIILWPFKFFPFRCLTPKREDSESEHGKDTTHSLHRGKVRKIQPGQKIHLSVVSSKDYSPKASPPPLGLGNNREFWDALKGIARNRLNKNVELYEQWFELDLLYHIHIELESLLKQPEGTLDSIVKLLRPDVGMHAFYEVVLAKLEDDDSGHDQNTRKGRLIGESLRILGSTEFKFQLRPIKEVWERIVGNPQPENQSQIDYHQLRSFLNRFSQMFQTYLEVNSCVVSVAFSPDGKWLASGLDNGRVLLWDTKSTSQTGKALGHHSKPVTSVVFSPDGKYLVSGSYDSTIRFWDIENMKQVGDPWTGHTDYINSVAFSHDVEKVTVVSGSDDNTLRLWDPQTGKEIAPLKGHTNHVLSVAFSPDSQNIVSGSYDKTVRIWDACTHEQVGDPLEGHTDWVRSVAYSPDGKQIASGSWDHTICIWDAERKVQVGEPLQGHSNTVVSVCFSPKDGKLLASASSDCTIRIWNVVTGVQIGEALSGLDSTVRSVVFLPDGNQLASASHDQIIRIWDIGSYVELFTLN